MRSGFRTFLPIQLEVLSNGDRYVSFEPTFRVLKSNQWKKDQLTRLKGEATLNQ